MTRTTANASPRMILDDTELWKSLNARLEQRNEKKENVPLGMEDTSALSMGPSDVIQYVMNAMLKNDFEALLGFSAKLGGKVEDFLGQIETGAFSEAETISKFFNSHPRYSTLVCLSEWKAMGSPDTSHTSRQAAQKLLVRRHGGNWEDLFINLRLVEAPAVGKRWVITSIYKQKGHQE